MTEVKLTTGEGEVILEGTDEEFTAAVDKVAAGVGHNSRNKVGGINADQLKSIIARIEKLEEEKSAISCDIKDVFAEAKGNGFCTKTIKEIIKIRKLDVSEREEAETILDTYLHALNMQMSMELE